MCFVSATKLDPNFDTNMVIMSKVALLKILKTRITLSVDD